MHPHRSSIYLICITLEGDVHVADTVRNAHHRKCICDLLSWMPSSRGRPSSREAGLAHLLCRALIQGDTEEFAKPPVDLVPTIQEAGGPLL